MSSPNLDNFFWTESAKDLLRKQVGQENLELIVAGKRPSYPFETLNWRPSKFNDRQEWVYFSELPLWTKKLVYPIHQNNYRYTRTQQGNLTRTKT